MSEPTNLDRQLSSYLEGRSVMRAPAGLLEASLGEVDRTRQHGAWRLVVRRFTEGLARMWTPPVSVRLVVALIVLMVAAVIGGILITSSQRRLPPPFGPAQPGILVVEVSGHLGLMNPDGTGLRMLTSAPEVDRYPVWSPDGTRFAFVSSQDKKLALVVMDADSGQRITLADGLGAVIGARGMTHFGSQIPMSWSPDSQRIVFAASVDEAPHLYVTSTDRPGASRIGGVDMYGVSPSWSPDGTLIAFKRVHACCGGEPDALWVIRPDGGDARKLSDAPAVRDVLTDAAWAPDGKRLAYLAEGTNASNDVYVINADGTGQRALTDTPQDEEWASWSPDGTRLVISWATDPNGTFIIEADGSDRVNVPTYGHLVSTPAWAPDGSRILGYFDAGLLHAASDGFVILDPTGHDRPVFIREVAFGSVSWQRLAP
jgi:WD40 repeat protein